jgi:APA family basic amino acid/polyamine antiporter
MDTNAAAVPSLERSIGLYEATAMVVGTIIGASIFVQPSEVTGHVPTELGIYAVWVACGILTLFGALVCAELASTFPEAGGVYVYLREAYGPALGFLYGWAMFWTMHSGIIAVVAVVVARYAAFFVPLGHAGGRAVAVGAILALSAVNYVGVRQGSALQAAFTVGKVAAVVGIVALGFTFGGGAHGAVTTAPPAAAEPGPGAGSFALAMVAGLFAFGGWHMVTYNAEETRDARRTLPRALIFGTLAVTVCYVALNAVYLYVLPMRTVASSSRVAADAADAVFGNGGGAVMSALVVFSALGALSGIILAGPRVYFAMARDGLLFRWAGAVHPRFHTPHRAIVLQAVWASVLVVTGTYRALFTRVVYTEWIFFGLMAVGLVLLRRRPGLTGEYRIRAYPWVPIVFAVCAFALVANQVAAARTDSVAALGLVLLGFPVYHFWARRGYHTPASAR